MSHRCLGNKSLSHVHNIEIVRSFSFLWDNVTIGLTVRGGLVVARVLSDELTESGDFTDLFEEDGG